MVIAGPCVPGRDLVGKHASLREGTGKGQGMHASQPFPAGPQTGSFARPQAIPAGRGDLPGRGESAGRGGAEFTGRISTDSSSAFPAEPGRYQLYASLACPWS